MKRKALVTLGEQGLHMRPTVLLARTLVSRFDPRATRVVVRAPSWTMRLEGSTVVEPRSQWNAADGFNTFDLVSLNLEPYATFEVLCEGERTGEVLAALKDLFETDEHFAGTAFEEVPAEHG